MESLALSSTSVASSRSLAAILASSMAATMHANPGFWANGIAPVTTTVSSGGITSSGTGYPAATCTTAGTGSCVPASTASYDLQQWQTALGQALPGYLATITCSQQYPVTCTIVIQWTENAVATSSQQNQLSSLSQPTYTLFVQP
jgi:type IV pilus assembly protein PilV